MTSPIKPLGFLDDDAGNHSSKRLDGTLLILFGICVAASLVIYSFFKVAADATIIFEVFKWSVITGAGLLSVGVAEPYFNNFKKKNGDENA